MAAHYAEVTDTGQRWRSRWTPVPNVVDLVCAGGGPAITTTLADVSTFGCRVSGENAEAVGDHVRLTFSGYPPVAATVVWRGDAAIGCRFDKPIATSLMRALLCGEG